MRNRAKAMGCAKSFYREMNDISNGKAGGDEISIIKFQRDHKYFASMAKLMFEKEDEVGRHARLGRWGGVLQERLIVSCVARCKKDGQPAQPSYCEGTLQNDGMKRCLAAVDIETIQGGRHHTRKTLKGKMEPAWIPVLSSSEQRTAYEQADDSGASEAERYYAGLHEDLSIHPATKGPNNNVGQIMRGVYRFKTCSGSFTALSEYNWAMWYVD